MSIAARRHQRAISRPRFYVGARCKPGPDEPNSNNLSLQWQTGVSTFGPLAATRAFEQTLPATASYFTPSDVLEIPSFKDDAGGNMASYVNSMRGDAPMFIFHHEPEADYATGAQFVSEWTSYRNAAKAARPSVQFGMIAGGFQYRPGNNGADGSFIPPNADWYGFDTYRKGTDTGVNAVKPLTELVEFQTWYSFVASKGKPLWITEYGRYLLSVDESGRPGVIAADHQWLVANGFAGWMYWWSNRSNDVLEQWRFTDQPSIDAWSAVVAAHAQ
ncbi:hypothetical protein IPL68_01975 [Candidatus Saccharibacteria bacterium]|nr:MAG: hypothetical protein IPL68_01975 [Candidatus Saccharibacteria bacterium]